MLRVGSYVWYHERNDPETIARLFKECNVILLQRVPRRYTANFGDCHFIENWQNRGMMTKGGRNISVSELPENHVVPNFSQGRYVPILDLGVCKIINCLPSYDIPSSHRQLDYIMSLADDNTVIVGDMHWEDAHINSLYIKHQLINHMHKPTFTGRHGEQLSLDKILTNTGIEISDIIVHDNLANNNIEHYPMEFTINV